MSNTINVALVGIGNCASSLIQGKYYYAYRHKKIDMMGLMREDIGGYLASDLKFVAAYDVDDSKVGRDLSFAIKEGMNNTREFVEVPHLDCEVQPAPIFDGLGSTYLEKISIHKHAPKKGEIAAYADKIRRSGAEIVVNYLPVGSEDATRFWADVSAAAGCAFVNTIPVFIAREDYYDNMYKAAGVPLLGDDIKSQIGATIVHRELVKLCKMRGISVDRTYQLNFGGNMDFYNMLDRSRLSTKKKSKTGAVHAELSELDPAKNGGNTHISPSDYVEWLDDRKWAFIRIEGTAFGGAPYMLETKLEVWDSPNSAGVVIDAVRCAKVAMERGDAGVVPVLSAFFFKSPPEDVHDDVALLELDRYLEQVAV